MSTKRLARGYQPDFDLDAAVGHQGEMFVHDIGKALADGTAEVKTDEKSALTGNVYVEWSCLRRGKWHLSGIATTPSEVWVTKLGRVLVVAPTAVVRQVARDAWADGPHRRSECTAGSHPTKGVLLPVDSLVRRYMAADRSQP